MEILPTSALELMDDPACPIHTLQESLRDLALINRLLGAHALIRGYLDRVIPVWRRRAGAAPDPLSVLDVGTGGADVPATIVAWARRRGVPVRIVGIDRHPLTVRIAASSVPPGHVSVGQADAAALPFRNASFDVCRCNLAPHHLNSDTRVARRGPPKAVAPWGFLVLDRARRPGGSAGGWLLTGLFPNPFIRHGGPLSGRRSMTWSEYVRCARDADVAGLRLVRLPMFRVALSRTG